MFFTASVDFSTPDPRRVFDLVAAHALVARATERLARIGENVEAVGQELRPLSCRANSELAIALCSDRGGAVPLDGRVTI